MRVILVSHGDFAKSLLASAQMIIGQQEDAYAFGLYPADSIEEVEARVEACIAAAAGETVVLSDLFHGSPFNAVTRLMHRHAVRHITGMNLPLVIEILTKRNFPDLTCAALCEQAIEATKNSVIDVKKYLEEVDQ